MRFFHLSDLHIGKQLYFYDRREDQEAVLWQIAEYAQTCHPDAILIAGDIYDKAVPSGEAYELFDSFLNQLSEITPQIPVLIIAGNHDNASRLNYAGSFLAKHQIYLSVMPPQQEGEYLKKITLEDSHGPVNFYMLPFMKPGYVKKLFPEENISDYNRAVKAVIERENIDLNERNVLIAHQFFVSGSSEPEKCESEYSYISVGGIDSVDVSCVKMFDYVALGHIHGEQKIGAEHVRYCGTPLKYSVSEEHHKKAILMVTMGEKGQDNEYAYIPLKGKYDVRSVRGRLEDILAAADDSNRDDYLSVTLTDENVYRPKDKLDEKYSHVLEVRMDNKKTRAVLQEYDQEEQVLDPLAAFAGFYQEMNGQPLSEEESEVLAAIVADVKNSMDEE